MPGIRFAMARRGASFSDGAIARMRLSQQRSSALRFDGPSAEQINVRFSAASVNSAALAG